MSKHTTLGQLQKLAERTKGITDSLDTRVTNLENTKSEANVIEGVQVNGALLALTDKIANILIAEGSTNGTISVNNVDVAVKGLAAMAYKSEVSYDELASALKTTIDEKAKQSDLDTLTGSGEGSISKMIDAAFDDFATKVSDDNVVNTYKELIDWAAEHGSDAAEIVASVQAIEAVLAGIGGADDDYKTVAAYVDAKIKAAAYTHPTYTESAAAFRKIGRDATGHVVVGDAVTKDDITGLGIPAQDTTYEEATQSAAGLMSAADKKKLDGYDEASDTEVEAMLVTVFGEEKSDT
jgi:hypothetical protein